MYKNNCDYVVIIQPLEKFYHCNLTLYSYVIFVCLCISHNHVWQTRDVVNFHFIFHAMIA